MAKDNHDKQTRSLPLERRGRKPKLASGAMSQAERKAAERARRRARGEIQMWLTPAEVAAVEAMRTDNNERKESMKTYDEWCERCDADTPHTLERVVERWQDDSIDDCELSEVEMIRRVNGDIMTRCTCTVCGYTREEL